MNKFIYEQAFSRNIGWVTDAEQAMLRGKRVAVAGLGGVGGFHLLTLARLGVGSFHIADFDTFEIANLNRQVGALVSTLGRAKVEVLTEMAKDINPELDIQGFPDGVSEANLDKFLAGVDLLRRWSRLLRIRGAPRDVRSLCSPARAGDNRSAAWHGCVLAQLSARPDDLRAIFPT